MFENFPYSNFHDLNTDWLIKRVKNVETSEANAKASEEAAAESATAAAQSATASDQSAQASAQSAQASAQSAEESANSATEANEYVTSTRDQVNLLQSRVDNIIPSGTQTEGNTELLDIRVGYNGERFPSAGDAVRGQVYDLNTDLNVYDEKIGLHCGRLVKNALYPYIDVPINAKNGEWVAMKLAYYSADLTNLSRWYALNPDNNQTLYSPISTSDRCSFKANGAINTIRFIFQQLTNITDNIYVGIECYIYSKRTVLDIAENYTVQEYNIQVSNTGLIDIRKIPFYIENGDVFEVEIIDNDNILSSDWASNIGFAYGGTFIDNVLYLSKHLPKRSTKISVPVDPDTMRLYISGDYVSGTGTLTIKYKNLTKMGLSTINKRYTSFSILGDSYSTFAEYTNPTTNRQWYPTNDPTAQGYNTGNNVTSLSHTWWYILGDETDLYMKENASYSGSTICYDSYGDGGADGKDTSFIQRVGDLENSSLLFIFGGTNDNWAGASIGEYKYSGWTESDLSYFAPALAYLIDSIKKRYIGMDIIFISNDALSNDYKNAINVVCSHYKVPVIQLNGISKIYNHPDVNGMRQIANSIKNYLNGYIA